MLATQTRKGAKNDMSCLRQFFGPACKALEFGSRVPRKFRDGVRELPKVPDKFSKVHVPVKRLEQVSCEMISAFIQERVITDGIAAKTANGLRGVLHRMFNYAIEQFGYVCPDKRHRNPVQGVRRMKEDAPVITWLKTEEIDEQLEALEDHPQVQAMVAMYIFAGLRREAGVWLTHEDVDLDARILHVRAKEIGGEFWQPKTKRNRSVPFSTRLYEILSEYEPPKASAWFFPGPTGNRWHPDHFSQTLREINEAAGLSWSCLDYRHTFGSHLAQKGERTSSDVRIPLPPVGRFLCAQVCNVAMTKSLGRPHSLRATAARKHVTRWFAVTPSARTRWMHGGSTPPPRPSGSALAVTVRQSSYGRLPACMPLRSSTPLVDPSCFFLHSSTPDALGSGTA